MAKPNAAAIPSKDWASAPIKLPDGSKITDIQVQPQGSHGVVPILAVQNDDNTTPNLFIESIDPEGWSASSDHRSYPNCTVLDAKFDTYESCLVLIRSEDSTIELLRQLVGTGGSETAQSSVLLRSFSSDGAFHPRSLLVGGREGKKVAVLFGDGGNDWMTLDLSG